MGSRVPAPESPAPRPHVPCKRRPQQDDPPPLSLARPPGSWPGRAACAAPPGARPPPRPACRLAPAALQSLRPCKTSSRRPRRCSRWHWTAPVSCFRAGGRVRGGMRGGTDAWQTMCSVQGGGLGSATVLDLCLGPAHLDVRNSHVAGVQPPPVAVGLQHAAHVVVGALPTLTLDLPGPALPGDAILGGGDTWCVQQGEGGSTEWCSARVFNQGTSESSECGGCCLKVGGARACHTASHTYAAG